MKRFGKNKFNASITICLKLTVDTGEDVSDKSDLSQTKFFELFLVASDVSVGTLVQFGVERVDTGLTGGKTLSESAFIFVSLIHIFLHDNLYY